MTTSHITITIKVTWWVRWYLRSVALFALLSGMELDYDKVTRTVLRGISLR